MRFDAGCDCCRDPAAEYEDWLLRGVRVLTHPLARQALARLRDSACGEADVAAAQGSLVAMLIVEATADFSFDGPGFAPRAEAPALERLIVVDLQGMDAPALNASLGLEAALARDLAGTPLVVHAASLRSGRRIVAALEALKRRGAGVLRLVCPIVFSMGVEAVRRAHPDVLIHTVAIEDDLDDDGAAAPSLRALNPSSAQ